MGLFIQLEMHSYGSCRLVLNSEPSQSLLVFCHFVHVCVCVCCAQPRMCIRMFVNLANSVHWAVHSKLKLPSVTNVCIAYLTGASAQSARGRV